MGASTTCFSTAPGAQTYQGPLGGKRRAVGNPGPDPGASPLPASAALGVELQFLEEPSGASGPSEAARPHWVHSPPYGPVWLVHSPPDLLSPHRSVSGLSPCQCHPPPCYSTLRDLEPALPSLDCSFWDCPLGAAQPVGSHGDLVGLDCRVQGTPPAQSPERRGLGSSVASGLQAQGQTGRHGAYMLCPLNTRGPRHCLHQWGESWGRSWGGRCPSGGCGNVCVPLDCPGARVCIPTRVHTSSTRGTSTCSRVRVCESPGTLWLGLSPGLHVSVGCMEV